MDEEECSLSFCCLRSTRIHAVQPKVRGTSISQYELSELQLFDGHCSRRPAEREREKNCCNIS
ncbi:hypothetical protein ABG768_006095, partial [Culter alburnus]